MGFNCQVILDGSPGQVNPKRETDKDLAGSIEHGVDRLFIIEKTERQIYDPVHVRPLLVTVPSSLRRRVPSGRQFAVSEKRVPSAGCEVPHCCSGSRVSRLGTIRADR